MNQLQKSTSTELSKIGDALIGETNIKQYEVRVNRERPGCFVFLIDQSGSMANAWGNDSSKSKAELVALYVNNALNEIINICQKSEPEPRDYFEVAMIGYGANDHEAAVLWEGSLKEKVFITPADLKKNPTGNQGEIEVVRRTFKGETIVKIPVTFWFKAVAEGLTPMGNALDLSTEILEEWIDKHANSFPPIVINITDGEQTDCSEQELLEKAHRLKSLKTLYGKTLFFNAHISSRSDEAVLFPESLEELGGNNRSRLLYEMSSSLPQIFRKRVATEVKKTDMDEDTTYVAMTYQASVGDLTRFLYIGTKTVQP